MASVVIWSKLQDLKTRKFDKAHNIYDSLGLINLID